MDKKNFDKQFQEVDQLKARVAELEKALKMWKNYFALKHESAKAALACQ